ncbi:hypothetical protein FJTKL_14360 [Diaporthe vaccinii]|uniref:Beta-lactamase-related domain-containing protein n=1 Tax=Diaporthe vaccinii TaxID=105482 RepID=A0ABR4E881_9PEZI
MCHTTGLGKQNPLIQGIKGNVLVDEDSFVALINHAPTHDTEQHQGGIQSGGAAKGQAHHSDSPGEMGRGGNEKEEEQARNSTTCNSGTFLPIEQDAIVEHNFNDSFRDREFVYNNYSMALVGLAVQNASGQRYSTFIQERILDLLGMDGIIATRCRMESHQNVAVGYVKLKDNTLSEVATEAMTDDAHTPILSVIGVRSSVDDMLKLTKAMIAAYNREVDQSEEHHESKAANPLRQVSTIWKTWAEIDEGLSYGMGCYKLKFPSLSFSSGGINAKTRSEEPEFFKSHVVGQDLLDSPEHVKDNVIAHVGYNNGFTSSVTIFPRTQTAIVALANGMDLGDPTDWAVKILAQALFETTPQVDLVALATKEADLWRRWFDNILIEWLADRRIMHQESDLAEYVGDYEGLNTTVHIFLNPETAHLAMTINSCEGSRFGLELYGYDTYSFFPLTKDEWLRNGMWDWDEYYVAVLYFHRDDDGKVNRFSWRYEAAEEDGRFYKTQGMETP